MFANHQPAISAYARQSPDNLARVIQFVVLTIRQPLYNVPADMAQAEAGGQDAMAVLWGWKHDAYAAAWRDRATIYAQCEDIWQHAKTREQAADDLLAYLATLPGLGLAKAGFVAQLAYGVSGCIDTHNLQLFGFSPRAFRGDKFKELKSLKQRRTKVRKYNSAVDRCGGTQSLWDGWCEFVAAKYPQAYRDAFHVSAIHCEALGLEPQ